MNIYPTPEQVAELVTSIVPEVDGGEAAENEIESTIRKIPPITSPAGLISRFITLVDVVHQSLIPCLVATPFVYPSETEWTFASHKEFRAKKREQLKGIEGVLKASDIDTSKEKMNPLLDNFEGILREIFRVRIPAMPSVYLTDNFYD